MFVRSEDLIREGTIAGWDTDDWYVVEAGRVGHAGRRQLPLLGFADNYCVNLEDVEIETKLAPILWEV